MLGMKRAKIIQWWSANWARVHKSYRQVISQLLSYLCMLT